MHKLIRSRSHNCQQKNNSVSGSQCGIGRFGKTADPQGNRGQLNGEHHQNAVEPEQVAYRKTTHDVAGARGRNAHQQRQKCHTQHPKQLTEIKYRMTKAGNSTATRASGSASLARSTLPGRPVPAAASSGTDHSRKHERHPERARRKGRHGHPSASAAVPVVKGQQLIRSALPVSCAAAAHR